MWLQFAISYYLLLFFFFCICYLFLYAIWLLFPPLSFTSIKQRRASRFNLLFLVSRPIVFYFLRIPLPKYFWFFWIKSKLMLHFSTWVDKLLSSIEMNFFCLICFYWDKNYLFCIHSLSRLVSHRVWYAIVQELYVFICLFFICL